MLLLRGGRVAQLQLAVLLLWFVVAEPSCGAAVADRGAAPGLPCPQSAAKQADGGCRGGAQRVAWFSVVDSDGSGGNAAIFVGSRLICRQTGVVCCADIIVMLWMRWCCATAAGGAAKQAGGGCRRDAQW